MYDICKRNDINAFVQIRWIRISLIIIIKLLNATKFLFIEYKSVISLSVFLTLKHICTYALIFILYNF